MTSKKGKKRNTNKNTESKQLSPQIQTSKQSKGFYHKGFSMYNLGRLITAISVLLNFWFAYLVLCPKVTIDYASHLIPENPVSLPIKISNLGYLSVCNVKIIIEDGNLQAGGVFMHGNKTYSLLCAKLASNKSIDYIYNSIIISNLPANATLSGYLSVTVQYQLPILSKIISENQRFKIYKSKDGYTRWLVVQ